MSEFSYLSAIKNRQDLKKYNNYLSLFALQLFFGIDDIEAVVADDLLNIDGPDDCGLDFIHIDTEQKFAVVGQEYVALGKKKKSKTAVASDKKARDLSSGLAVLLKKPIEEIPEKIRSSASKLRVAIAKEEIETVHIWYVHNLSGSKNVKKELRTAEVTARSIVGEGVNIRSLEVSSEEIEKRYKSISVPILINDGFEIPIVNGARIKSTDWDAFVMPVSLQWLYKQFKKYGNDLFSANVRDYLGISKKIDKNINNGIRETAEKDPAHFWIFNNGMTALVHNFSVSNEGVLKIEGISILNGAQTTGAIGNLSSMPNKDAMVQIRFVKCNSEKTVAKIKRYNNSQNKVEVSDFRSRDSIQERLKTEFLSTDINYLPRRGGIADIVKRKNNALTSILAGQVLAAFHGRSDIAYHQKTKIWDEDELYIKYFNEHVRAKHILFAYSLFEVIKNKKLSIIQKGKKNMLKTFEKEQLLFFQTRGSVFLLMSAVTSCLEIFLDKSIANKFRLEFRGNRSFNELMKDWEVIVDIASQLAPNLQEGFSEGAIREDRANEAIKKFTGLVATTQESNKEIFSNFAKKVMEFSS